MKSTLILLAAALACAAAPLACSSDPDASPADAGISLGEGGYVDAPDPDADRSRVDGGFLGPDGGVLREDRFVMKVVSFTPGPCAGFGASEMPGVIQGPPVGAGELKGSFDVVSLGIGGEIVVSFEPNEIVDGPGPDFIVFENAFYAAGNPATPAADLAEVGVSDDGVTWKTYPCTPGPSAPYGACAGWHPVYSAPGNGISPVDPEKAGGEAYDLAAVGLASARFVRIKDMSSSTCDVVPKPTNAGFDLDAISIVNAKIP
ncbi:MAG: cell surface protein [Labilithrix sp.]|nr:cell surface protein [Labilithrix sp.]